MDKRLIVLATMLGIVLVGCTTGNSVDINGVRVPVQDVSWKQSLPYSSVFAEWNNTAPGKCKITYAKALEAASAAISRGRAAQEASTARCLWARCTIVEGATGLRAELT